MKSIKTKLIAIYAAVVLFVMIISGTFMLFTVRNMEIERTRDALRSHAQAINERIVQPYEPEGFWAADAWLLLAQSEYDIDGMILSSIGLPIAPQEFVQADMWFNDQSVVWAIAGEEGFNVGVPGAGLDGAMRQWLTFAMPVQRADETFIVYARVDALFMNESLSRLMFNLVAAILIALVLTVVFWFFLGNTITNPIAALTRHTKAIAAGDLSRRIDINSNDEIGQLAKDSNFMADQLSRLLGSMASEKNKSEAVLLNTPDGVLAFEATGALLHANNASADLMQGIDFNRMNLDEIISLFGFQMPDAQSLSPGDIHENTIEHAGNSIAVTMAPYLSQGGDVDGYVFVLQDVSKQVRLDNMRKEFVANVSHELRTPLTNICTYTETLLGGASTDAEVLERFLRVIDNEARRMSHLVSDLLELSSIDSGQRAPEMDVVDLAALLRVVVRQAQAQAAAKKQIIELEVPQTQCFVEANAARINQVVQNCLSNAIKYSHEGTAIRVAMEIIPDFFEVRVVDEGIGIPADSLQRVFERFYRVDKARARAMGGTGLGLAIVKEIMHEHGGSVDISSEPNRGTTITLRFCSLKDV